MATSGTLNSSSYGGRKLVFSWSCSNQGGGKVKVSWTLKSTGGSSSWYATGPTTLTVNGSEVYSKSRYNMYTGQLDSGSFTKTYSGGTTTFKASIKTAIYTASTSTKSDTFTLPKIYKQTYSLNGASGTAPSATYAYNGGSVTLPSAPSRSGYTFKGWNSSSSGANTMRAAGSSITPTQDTTYYAIWQINALVPVKYNANGGSGTAPTHSAVNYGSSFTTKPNTSFTRAGYKLSKWNTAADGSGTSYSCNTAYTLSWTSTKTLYAIWTPYVLTVNYSSNNATSGTLGGTAISGLSADKDVTVFSPTYNYSTSAIGDGDAFYNYTGSDNHLYLKKDYYTGTGYYCNGSHTFEMAQGSYSISPKALAEKFGKDLTTANVSIIIYPVWRQNVLTVNYYANGGVLSGSTSTTTAVLKTTTHNSMATYDNGLNDYSTTSSSSPGINLTRKGYTATNKWNTKADGSGSSIGVSEAGTGQFLAGKLGKTLINTDQSVNVYAQWSANNYTVTFNGNGATKLPASSKTVTYDSTTNRSQTGNIPTKTGYVFLGWSSVNNIANPNYIWDYEGTCQYDGKYWSSAGKWAHDGNLTVYAMWQDENSINKFYFFNSGQFFARELVEFDRDEDPYTIVEG